MLAVVDVSKRELAGVISSQSVCGGREITDIGIFLQRVMLLSVIFLQLPTEPDTDNFGFGTPSCNALFIVVGVERIIGRVMQTAALLALNGLACDEVTHVYHVA